MCTRQQILQLSVLFSHPHEPASQSRRSRSSHHTPVPCTPLSSCETKYSVGWVYMQYNNLNTLHPQKKAVSCAAGISLEGRPRPTLTGATCGGSRSSSQLARAFISGPHAHLIVVHTQAKSTLPKHLPAFMRLHLDCLHMSIFPLALVQCPSPAHICPILCGHPSSFVFSSRLQMPMSWNSFCRVYSNKFFKTCAVLALKVEQSSDEQH